MSKRSFLKPLSMVLAALASAAASATTKNSDEALPSPTALEPDATRTLAATGLAGPIAHGTERELRCVQDSGDVFGFVLSRSPDGEFVAQHRSHFNSV